MKLSKTKIDRAGIALAKERYRSEDEYFELEEVFNDYRKSHLKPLTETTLLLQSWLSEFNSPYYIAQRLKRKPQIVRKLNRLSVRLTQLQDIGGARIIVESNNELDKLYQYLVERVDSASTLSFYISRSTDYRERGRDDSGYRALHLMIERDARTIELQLRSRVQHYWAESVERTSVIYGQYLKELEGDPQVLTYFKRLSDIFYEIESGREPSSKSKLELDESREVAEQLIQEEDRKSLLAGYVNDDILKTLATIESSRKNHFNNWIIIFDWNTGTFVSWDLVEPDPDSAIESYVKNENSYPATEGYEVVLIGSSDVSTVKQTHSHYFGIDKYDNILEKLDRAVIGFSRREDIDLGARQILHCLRNRKIWGKKKALSQATLKNHFCQNVYTFDYSLEVLLERGLVTRVKSRGPVMLNIKKKKEIEALL